ncbi:MAG: hypothetical protein JWO93_336 [Micrococcaceae bacterium]|nr:hypothetical protein [Micrococcaceae bacterium]
MRCLRFADNSDNSTPAEIVELLDVTRRTVKGIVQSTVCVAEREVTFPSHIDTTTYHLVTSVFGRSRFWEH